ncbi:DDE-type integrase/transposase/recombinase [Candidatus Methylobacter favarea]|uniref:DDE-type integrase/transposase/recombinase n=1 Tax=Candidatus Methylobacter favarea TaxID=2707345 RepID=UPI00157BF8BA|nr:DDE-type integrase/transposase/recombinase [Candidatus Methylobacter favarea]
MDEAVIVETRRKSLLPLDDLYDLLPYEEKAATKTFKAYEPGYLHIDTASINLGKDKFYLFVAFDRAARYVYLELHGNKRMETADFLGNALAQYPFKIEKILTDNGIEFSYNSLPGGKKPKSKEHPFAFLYKDRQIEHCTTLVKHPWTNGGVEAMNKKVKANTPNAATTTTLTS